MSRNEVDEVVRTAAYADRRDLRVTLVGPAYVVGPPVAISGLLSGNVTDQLDARLRDNGFAQCSVSDQPPTALAIQAVAKLLRQVGAGSGLIDAVVYGTCSFGHEPDPGGGLETVVRERVLRTMGLEQLPVYGVWLAESGNLASVVRLARALICNGRARTVLCVVADKVPEGPDEYREMPFAITINGDGAAACLLSAELPGAYTVEGVVQVAAPSITLYAKGQRGLRKHLQIISGVRSCVDKLYIATGQQPDAYRWLITNNYGHSTLGEFADMARLPRHALFLANIARYAHIFTADGLINLADLTRNTDVPAGERVLVLSSGPLTWGAIGLVRSSQAGGVGASAAPTSAELVVAVTRAGDAGADPVMVAAAAVADVLAGADIDASTVPLIVFGISAPGIGTSVAQTPLLDGNLSHHVVSHVVTANGLTSAVPFGIAVGEERLATVTRDCASVLMATDGLGVSVVVTVSTPDHGTGTLVAEASILVCSPAPQSIDTSLEEVHR
jgi:3-oxoacyl-[acyl-carrier-protein] synthase III